MGNQGNNGGFRFRDRCEAGYILANRLRSYANLSDVVVLGLAPGGVAVGAEIARALHAPLSVFQVRKLGAPGHQELGIGAITSAGRPLIDAGVTKKLGLSDRLVQAVVRRETRHLSRSQNLYNGGKKAPELKDRIVIVADDGAATGSSLCLAVQAVQQEGAAYVVVAVPVAPSLAFARLEKIANEIVCLMEPERFVNVRHWYQHFDPLTDREICQTLSRSAPAIPPAKSSRDHRVPPDAAPIPASTSLLGW